MEIEWTVGKLDSLMSRTKLICFYPQLFVFKFFGKHKKCDQYLRGKIFFWTKISNTQQTYFWTVEALSWKNIFNLGLLTLLSGYLCPPSCCPRFESQAHHLFFFSFYIVQIVHLSFELECERNEYKQKDTGIGPFLKKSIYNFKLLACLIASQISK